MNSKSKSFNNLAYSLEGYNESFVSKIVDFDADDNTVFSALGAWVLTAVIAGGNPNSIPKEKLIQLETTLGMSLHVAYETAVELIKEAPEVVKASLGAWLRPDYVQSDEVASKWLNNIQGTGVLHSQVGLPSQAELDDWADKATLGLIKTFPYQINSETLVLIATALASKVAWREPYSVEGASETMINAWGQESVLFSKKPETFLLQLEDGIYAVHYKDSDKASNGLRVLSVIGPKEADAGEIIQVANMIASDFSYFYEQRINVEELPVDAVLPDFASIEDSVQRVLNGNTDLKYRTYLPAWSGECVWDINDLGLVDSLYAISTVELPVEAKQSIVASYNKNGFEAAAITYFAIAGTSLPRISEERVRTLEVNFSHPYAVVAYVPASVANESHSSWRNIPVYNAWVKKASAVQED